MPINNRMKIYLLRIFIIPLNVTETVAKIPAQPEFKIQKSLYKKQQQQQPELKNPKSKNFLHRYYMINQSNTSPTPGTTKYSHKYAIPTNIPPTTPNDPYSYQYYPQQAQAESKFPTLKPLSPHQIKIQDESQQNWNKKQNQPEIEQLQNQNTLAKLLMFDSSDLASRENNNGGKIASSQYYSLNEGNSSNGQKSLNISNAVKYVNSRYEAYPTQVDSPTTPPLAQPHKQSPQQTTSNPTNTANPTQNTISESSSVYPNISNLPLFQSEYQYNYGYASNTNQVPLYRNPITNMEHNLYEYSKQNKQTTYSNNTNINTNKYPNQYKNNHQQSHPQQQHQLELSQSSHNNPSQQSDQSQDVLYTFLIKLINILNNKLRTQYRYTFQALYLNSKFKPFMPNPPSTAGTGQSTGYQQWNNYSINKNNNNSWNQNRSWNKNNNNNNMEPNQMQYTYALPTDMPKNNKNSNYANNRQSNSINTYTYSHTSGDKSVSLSNDPEKGKQQDKEREKLRVSDQQDMKGRDKQLQSIPSHALSSISSIDQQGNIHNISYPYNVSTSMNDNNMYQFTQRKHIFAIQDNNPNNYGNQTYPYPTQTATNNSHHNNKPNIHTHTNTNKISNTKSLNLQKSPYTQTHPSPHHHSPHYNHQAQHNWQYNNNSPTFHKIIQEQQQQSNTNTNSNIGSSIHAGVVSQFQFNSNLKAKAKGKNANIRNKNQQPAYPYPHYVQSTANPDPTPRLNKQNDYNNNSSQQVSPTKPLSIQLAPLTPSQYAFPKADKSIELTLAAKEPPINHTTNKKQSPTKNPTAAKLEPLSTDSLIDTILETSNQQPIYLQTSQQTPAGSNPHNRYYNQQDQQEEQQEYEQQQQEQDEQNINQQDNNRQYNLQYNSRNNTNNHNSNSQSNSNNSSNKKNINNNYNVMNTNTNISSNTNNLFNTNTNMNMNMSMNNNVKTDSNMMGSHKVGNNNPQPNTSNIQNNINQIPTMDHTTINNTTNPSNNITANIHNNISHSDKVIQQQPIYIDVGQPVTYQKILLNNQNIGRSISSYVENNIFENAGNRQHVPPAAQYRGEGRERPVTYNPAPMHFQNLPVQVRPNSNIQNNISINTGRSSAQILLKYPHIVVSSPRQTQNPQRELIPIRFNSVSPPAKNQRVFSQNKLPHIKILQQKPVQPQPQPQPKQIFVTFNQDSSTRRPVSQPSRPISTLTSVKPIVMPAQQIKANVDHKRLVQVRADYFGHDARVPAGNVIINNKVVRQASPVLKEVRSTPQLPRINAMPEQNNILNNGRIRNVSPPQPYNVFPVPSKAQPPITSIPIPQQSPKKSQQNQSSVRSSLQSNKLSHHQARPQSALMATTPINTLKQVPFVKVQDVLPKSKIINTGDNISIQRQVRMDQTFINKLDGQIQSKPASKTNIGNGTNAYFDYYQAPKKQRPSIQQPQQLQNNQYLINVEPSLFIKGKQAFNFQTSPSTSPKHVLHTSPPPQIRHPQPHHHIFPTKQQKIPEQLPLHPIYREYHDGATSRPGSNRKKLNLVSKQQAYDSKISNSRQEINDY